MVSTAALWLPILVSAVFVFFISFLFHMVLPLHKGDWKRLPNEDGAQDALRPLNIPPGDYMMPVAGTAAQMKTAEYKAKFNKGPVAIMTFYPPGRMHMGESLVQWFGYLLLVGFFAALIAGGARGPGAGFGEVVHFAGLTAFVGYWLAMVQQSVWYKRSWGVTLLYGFEGLVYGLVTGATFGWLWPK